MTLFDIGWQFAEVTGFSVSEFALLFNRFGDILARTCMDDPSETKSVLGRPRSLDPRSQLRLFLLWIRQYPVERLLAWMFYLDIKQVYQYNRASLYVLYNYYNKQLVWPDKQFRYKHGVTFRKVLVTVVGDGTEQQILVPSLRDTEQITYFGKKAKYTFTLLVAYSPDGHIYFVSHSYPGSMNDANVYDLPENWIHQYITEREWMMFDKGYTNVLKYCKRVAVPILGKQADLNEEEISYNNELASIRILIENVNREFKNFKICSHLYRAHTH